MGTLFTAIRRLVKEERYVVGIHATERLEERGILEWQVVDGIEDAVLLREAPDDEPNPSVEVEQSLADGTPVKVVWAHVISLDIAKLVPVHYFD